MVGKRVNEKISHVYKLELDARITGLSILSKGARGRQAYPSIAFRLW